MEITLEQRIQLAKDAYPEYHYHNTNDILDYFYSYKDYKKGKKVYWYYQNLFKFSPSKLDISSVPVMYEDVEYFCRFHNLMQKGFSRYGE